MGTATIPLPGQFEGTGGVHRSSFQADLYDNDRATSQTVRAMSQHIRDCASDPYIRWAAHDAIDTWGKAVPAGFAAAAGIQQGDGREMAANAAKDARRAAWACWWWVKHNCKFVQDDEQLLRLLNERDQLELLITPSVMVRLAQRQGDCDDFTMLVCCLLEALGVPWRIVTVAVDPYDRERWSHVFGACVLENGSLMMLDTSHGLYPGWSIPQERIFRLQVWGMDGSPAREEQRPMRGIRGLHGYTCGMGAVRMPRGRRMLRRRGVGDVSLISDSALPDTTIDLGSSVTGPIGVDPSLANQGVPIVYSPNPSYGASNNNALMSFLGGETAALTKIFGQSVAPQTTIQTPQGLLITGPSGAIAQTSLPALSSSLSGSSLSSLLTIGVIGLVGVFAIKALAGK